MLRAHLLKEPWIMDQSAVKMKQARFGIVLRQPGRTGSSLRHQQDLPLAVILKSIEPGSACNTDLFLGIPVRPVRELMFRSLVDRQDPVPALFIPVYLLREVFSRISLVQIINMEMKKSNIIYSKLIIFYVNMTRKNKMKYYLIKTTKIIITFRRYFQKILITK